MMTFDALDVTIVCGLSTRSSRLADLLIHEPGALKAARFFAKGAAQWARANGRAHDLATATIDHSVYAHDGSSFRMSFRERSGAPVRVNRLADAAELAGDFCRSESGSQAVDRAVAWYLRWCADHPKAKADIGAIWRPSGYVVVRLKPIADVLRDAA